MQKILRALLIIMGCIVLVLTALILQTYRVGKMHTDKTADAIVVLGAAQYAGVPSPVLQARLDHAYDLYRKKKAPLIITTGGKASGDMYTEAKAGALYLQKKGVQEDAILLEEDSQTTKQNLTRVKTMMEEKKLHSVIIVSDPFHMLRALRIAYDLGIQAAPSSTETSPISKNKWLEFKYVMREVGLSLAHIFLNA